MKMRSIKFSYSLFLLVMISDLQSNGSVFKTQQQALNETFADCDTVIRKTLFLTDDQVQEIQNRAKVKIESKLVNYYFGVKNDSVLAFAFFETNVVRTKPETFMVILAPDATVKSTEILAFYEPQDYLPTPGWFQLFVGKILNDALWPKRDIHGVTGATLTVRAVTQGVRKILAIYQVAVKEVAN